MRGDARSYPPSVLEPALPRSGGRDVLTFAIGGEEYALGIEHIHEIIKNRPVTEVPRVPHFVAGIIAVRGVVMPVIDLRLRLRLPTPPLSERSRILVVMHGAQGGHGEAGAERFGLLVDRVHHVVRLEEHDIEPPTMLAGHEVEFLGGIGRLQRESASEQRGRTGPLLRQRQMIILLDLEKVLSFEHAGSPHGASHGALDRGEAGALRRGGALPPKEKSP